MIAGLVGAEGLRGNVILVGERYKAQRSCRRSECSRWMDQNNLYDEKRLCRGKRPGYKADEKPHGQRLRCRKLEDYTVTAS
jgi:hypothetical protein